MGLSGSILPGANRGTPRWGYSQPRPGSADRRRHSAGRGTTASAPATCTDGTVSGRTAIPCPATPKVSRTRRSCHQHPRPALRHHAAPTRGKGAAPPCATSKGARFSGGSKGGRATPRQPRCITLGRLAPTGNGSGASSRRGPSVARSTCSRSTARCEANGLPVRLARPPPSLSASPMRGYSSSFKRFSRRRVWAPGRVGMFRPIPPSLGVSRHAGGSTVTSSAIMLSSIHARYLPSTPVGAMSS